MHVTDSPSSLIRKQNFSTSRAELEAINTEKCRKWSFESQDSDSRNFWPFKKKQHSAITVLSAYSWNIAFGVKLF
jgi:hypothetical protein